MQPSGKIFLIGAVAALLVSGVLISRARDQGDVAPPRPITETTFTEQSAIARARAATTTRLALEDAPTIVVYKTPTCGCCTSWVAHLEEHGFTVEAHDLDDLTRVKRQLGISRALESCHTAEVDGYVIEGHVPADLIERMLRERPQIAGLAVPGMPMGSPGMEGPYNEPYDVLAFDSAGQVQVYDKR